MSHEGNAYEYQLVQTIMSIDTCHHAKIWGLIPDCQITDFSVHVVFSYAAIKFNYNKYAYRNEQIQINFSKQFFYHYFSRWASNDNFKSLRVFNYTEVIKGA